MFILFAFLTILILSLALALLSMQDFDLPNSITSLILGRKHRGTIVFFKNKIKHYQAKRSNRI